MHPLKIRKKRKKGGKEKGNKKQYLLTSNKHKFKNVKVILFTCLQYVETTDIRSYVK